jgi:hypothetical protein
MQIVPIFMFLFKLKITAAFAALILAVSPLAAQTGGGDTLKLSIEADPVPPEPGRLWSVVILADHPTPAEVRVQAPALPSLLRLERVRILPRVSDGVRQTAVEYEFFVIREGPFTLGSFEISAGGKRGLTPPLTIRSAGPSTQAASPLLPRLFWAAPAPAASPNTGSGGRTMPGALRVGEAAEIVLRYAYPPGGRLSTEPRLQSAAAWSYRPAPPENAILEILPGPPRPDPSPPTGNSQGETGVLLRLRVIPLEGPTLSLGETRLILDGRPLTVPTLELPINSE